MRISKTIILSLGGSIIVPSRINVSYLKKFRSLIIKYTKHGYRFVIVTGGGDTARHYQQGARAITGVTTDDLDWVGIAATKINAELIRSIFGSYAYSEVIANPTKAVKTSKKILVGSGWKPGFSSDKDAVLLAKAFGAKTVINMSNIKYVYSADPKKIKSAKPIKNMSWDELLRLTGRKWKPGAHVPFDPEASKLAQKSKIQVVVCLGNNLKNLEAIITGKRFVGTIIK